MYELTPEAVPFLKRKVISRNIDVTPVYTTVNTYLSAFYLDSNLISALSTSVKGTFR